MLKNKQTIKRFSESIKLKLLSELSEGKYNKRELSKLYNVHTSTITDWIHKYGRKDLNDYRILYLKSFFDVALTSKSLSNIASPKYRLLNL